MCREEEKEVQTGDLGRKLRKDMAQETNQSQAPLLCSTGCGSYGSSRNNGMCSLCHKDSLQRQNSNGCVSPPGSSTDSSTEESHQAQCPDSSPAGVSSADTDSGHCSVPTINSATSPKESTSGAKTCLTVNYLQSSELEGQCSAGCSGTKLSTQRAVLRNGTSVKKCTHKSKKRKVEDSYENIDVKRASQADVTVCTPVETQRKAKRNRCFTCRKKVGLIGFDCRCGNVFCSMHRYSDVHKCTFDYKADAAEKIRKQNPVIVGEKIQKI